MTEHEKTPPAQPILVEWSEERLPSGLPRTAFLRTPRHDVTWVAIPLTHFRPGAEGHLLGTACIVAPWLAITARHVSEALVRAWRDDHAIITNVRDTVFHVDRVFSSKPADIAFVHFVPLMPLPDGFHWRRAQLDLLPQPVGSRVAGFGYPSSSVEELGPLHWRVHAEPTTSLGTVVDVVPELRDRVMAPFPGFYTNARFDPGMSGGPIFNEAGHLCGIISTSMAPAEPGQGHSSYAATLWPSMAIELDVPWPDRYPTGHRYLAYELAQAKVFLTHNLDHVRTVLQSDGTPTVQCRPHDP